MLSVSFLEPKRQSNSEKYGIGIYLTVLDVVVEE
jgi:hypothetical protein